MKNTNIFNFLCTLIALGLLFLAFVKVGSTEFNICVRYKCAYNFSICLY